MKLRTISYKFLLGSNSFKFQYFDSDVYQPLFLIHNIKII